MNLILYNISWMGFNVFLALIPIVFGWLTLKTRQRFLCMVFVLIWLFFLPNTLYIFTDLRHIVHTWRGIGFFGKIGLVAQYAIYEIIGFSSFILALYPIEKKFLISRWRERNLLRAFLLVMANFLIGFGMVLGLVLRMNSWDILVDTPKVMHASLQIFSSFELMLLVLFFSVLANFLYFFFRKMLILKESPYVKKLYAKG